MAITQYPYRPGNITTRQAVKLIAEVVYPHLNETDGRKRVRERIRYARAQGKIPLSDSIVTPEFFRWALDANPDWEALSKVHGLPRSYVLVAAAGEYLLKVGSVCDAFVTPGDPKQLRDEFARIEIERQHLVEEVAEKAKRITELETEVNEWREKDRQMRAKRSLAGKRGGRGNNR